MNSRARNRLIGISAILIIVIAAALIYFYNDPGTARNLTVADIYGNDEFIGKTVKVSGTVISGSWDKNTNPMTFMIADPGDDGSGPQITVIYTGMMPSTFGDGVEAIITGILEEGNVIKTNNMITKCPSKYATSDDSYQVSELKSRQEEMINIPTRVTGIIKDGSIVAPGGAVRFVLVDVSDPNSEMNIRWDGGIPDDIKDGSRVVITGELDENFAFVATEVALAK